MASTDNLKNILTNLNLPDNQARVYLKLLELGEANYTKLAISTGIKRTTLYSVLEKMEKRGLINKTLDHKSFQPIPPAQLFESLQKNNLTLYHSLPLFQSLMHSPVNIAKVKFYNGTKGIQQLFLDELAEYKKKKEKVLRIFGSSAFYERDYEFKHEYVKKRKELGVNIKLIADPETKKYIKKYKDIYSTSQFKYSNILNNTSARFSATSDRIAIIGQINDNNGIIIESKEITNTFIKWFDFTWNHL